MSEDQARPALREGGCLCGSSRFKATLGGSKFHACHCDRCRKWGGGPALAVPATSVMMQNEAATVTFSSSGHGERIFCAQCGTHLFWRLKNRSAYAVWLGALDDSVGLSFGNEHYIDSKPDCYYFGNETTEITGDMMRAVFEKMAG